MTPAVRGETKHFKAKSKKACPPCAATGLLPEAMSKKFRQETSRLATDTQHSALRAPHSALRSAPSPDGPSVNSTTLVRASLLPKWNSSPSAKTSDANSTLH